MEKEEENDKKMEKEMSHEEFQRKLKKWFEEHGLLSDLRSHLRHLMITILQDTPVGLQPNVTSSPKVQALNLLVAEYLLRNNCHYTLSVFTSEVPSLGSLHLFKSGDILMKKTGGVIRASEGREKKSDGGSQYRSANNSPKFQREDVEDILNALGLSHMSEQVEATTSAYANNSSVEPLLSCLLRSIPELAIKLETRAIVPSVSSRNCVTLSQRWAAELTDVLLRAQIKHQQIPSLHGAILRITENEISRITQEESSKKSEILLERERKIQQHLKKYEEEIETRLNEAESGLNSRRGLIEEELFERQERLTQLAVELRHQHEEIMTRLRRVQEQEDELRESQNRLQRENDEQLLRRQEEARTLGERQRQMDNEFEKLKKHKASLAKLKEELERREDAIKVAEARCSFSRRIERKRTESDEDVTCPKDMENENTVLILKLKHLEDENQELRTQILTQNRSVSELRNENLVLNNRIEELTATSTLMNARIRSMVSPQGQTVRTNAITTPPLYPPSPPTPPPLPARIRISPRQVGAGEAITTPLGISVSTQPDINLSDSQRRCFRSPTHRSHVEPETSQVRSTSASKRTNLFYGLAYSPRYNADTVHLSPTGTKHVNIEPTDDMPIKRLKNNSEENISDDSSNSTDEILTEARLRLKRLEEESEKIDKKFTEFKIKFMSNLSELDKRIQGTVGGATTSALSASTPSTSKDVNVFIFGSKTFLNPEDIQKEKTVLSRSFENDISKGLSITDSKFFTRNSSRPSGFRNTYCSDTRQLVSNSTQYTYPRRHEGIHQNLGINRPLTRIVTEQGEDHGRFPTKRQTCNHNYFLKSRMMLNKLEKEISSGEVSESSSSDVSKKINKSKKFIFVRKKKTPKKEQKSSNETSPELFTKEIQDSNNGSSSSKQNQNQPGPEIFIETPLKTASFYTGNKNRVSQPEVKCQEQAKDKPHVEKAVELVSILNISNNNVSLTNESNVTLEVQPPAEQELNFGYQNEDLTSDFENLKLENEGNLRQSLLNDFEESVSRNDLIISAFSRKETENSQQLEVNELRKKSPSLVSSSPSGKESVSISAGKASTSEDDFWG